MDTSLVVPSTIAGIKNLAKQISRVEGCQHATALNKAAKVAGHANFSDAKRKLNGPLVAGGAPVSVDRLGIYITAYWSQVDSGRETLFLDYLPQWPSLLGQSKLSDRFRHLSRFRAQAADHLVSRERASSAEKAREWICAAARELQFMHATGLSKRSNGTSGAKVSALLKDLYKLPKSDHASIWFTRDDKVVLLDEPYPLSNATLQVRENWAIARSYKLVAVPWSVYLPSLIREMFLLCDDASAVQRLAQNIKAYPHQLANEGKWAGTSHPLKPIFLSPVRRSLNKSDMLPPSGIQRATAKTLPMGSSRRPNARMSLKDHEDIAARLNEIRDVSMHRAGIWRRIDRIRGELDDFVQSEYTQNELPNAQFSAMYYPGTNSWAGPRFLNKSQHQRLKLHLDFIYARLTANYPDSAPLRQLLKQINFARASLEKWAIASD